MQRSKARKQLGEFLRARRDRLKPEDFGLPAGQRRRAPGLRREEAALLCGISPTWFTWIEQGRTTSVSVPTLAAIARGLKLSRAERAYLFDLAARADPAPPAAQREDPVRLQRLVDAVRAPAYMLDRHWDAVVWNKRAAELFPRWLGRNTAGGAPRNLLQFVFLEPEAKRFIVDWAARARRLVAEYRADTAAWRDDPVRQALVHDLGEASAEFAAAWRSQAVLGRDGGRREFNHPRRGRCAYEQFTLRVAQRPDLKLTVLVPQ
ncbi:MAG TPA: helix-turn-helix transcriptional regulator [Gammaproteobacteria bacterium]|nr:helix-turn-helix transcriptional regulator [Gammaproteobacteria bacterium]